MYKRDLEVTGKQSLGFKSLLTSESGHLFCIAQVSI